MKNEKEMHFRLSVFHEFKASHSLEGFETPHFHLFRVSACFRVPYPISGDRVIDLVFLQKNLEALVAPVRNRYLNEALSMSPTSENLCVWLWNGLAERLPEAPLHAVSVELCDLDGKAMGKATLGS